MGRPNKKLRLIAGKRTAKGTFGSKRRQRSLCFSSDEEDDEGARNTSKIQERTDSIDMLLGGMGEKEFDAMIKANRTAAYPKWYARAQGYDRGSRTTIWRKKKNWQLTLKAVVPMRGIETYFAAAMKPATQQNICDAGAPNSVRDREEDEGASSPNIQIEAASHSPESEPVGVTTTGAAAADSNTGDVLCLLSNTNNSTEHSMMRCYGLIEGILAKNSDFSRRTMVQYITIQKCLACRIDGMGKAESAKTAAAALPKGRCFGSSRCIMNWTKVFLETEKLPVSEQGKHRKTASLLRDEDVSIRIHQWLLRTSKSIKLLISSAIGSMNHCLWR